MHEFPVPPDSGEMVFLRYFFARAYRSLFRPLYIEDVGADLGLSPEDLSRIAARLCGRGLLSQVSLTESENPLMGITRTGIKLVEDTVLGNSTSPTCAYLTWEKIEGQP